MQAIQTKYFGPSNVRGPRIKATCAAMSKTFPYDHALELAGNHRHAAFRLMNALDWTDDNYGLLVSGTLADGSYVHVLSGRDGTGDI